MSSFKETVSNAGAFVDTSASERHFEEHKEATEADRAEDVVVDIVESVRTEMMAFTDTASNGETDLIDNEINCTLMTLDKALRNIACEAVENELTEKGLICKDQRTRSTIGSGEESSG